MTIALNTSVALNSVTEAAGNRTWSGSLVIPSGLTDSLLVVGLNCYGGATAIRYTDVSGTLLTILVAHPAVEATAGRHAQFFYAVAPPAGTWPFYVVAPGFSMGQGAAELWTGVDQSTPFGTPVQAISGGTVSVTSPTGGVVIDVVGFENNDASTLTPNAGQTVVRNGAGTEFEHAALSYKAGSGSVSVGWTSGFPYLAVALQPSAGGGGTKAPPFLPGGYRPQFSKPRRRYL